MPMFSVSEVTTFARSWCRTRRLPRDIQDDLVQEALLAALRSGGSRRSVTQAMDRYRKREFRTEITLAALGTDLDESGEDEPSIRF